jgi:hypothetical protein
MLEPKDDREHDGGNHADVSAVKPAATRLLKVGVVLSGGQVLGRHNVICGISVSSLH